MSLHDQRALNIRGDPGLFSALGGALKGGVVGLLTGGPVGAVTGALGGAVGMGPGFATPMPTVPTPPNIPGPMGIYGGAVPITKVPGVTGVLQRALPGGATGYEAVMPQTAAGGPQGYHPNKSGYWTSAGYVQKGTKWVRNRRRNVSNGPANQRALRRLVAWDHADRARRRALKSITK